MIGNDIVDLALARKESNWKRNRFLDKIFSQKEQLLITNAKNSEIMVWNLWTRKEAAYKIYNRETGIRGYFPLQLQCSYKNENSGSVSINGNTYYTKTIISKESICTIAVTENKYFKKIINIDASIEVFKKNGIPFIIDVSSNLEKPVSISHHGRFREAITFID